jgi:hypothetical protein
VLQQLVAVAGRGDQRSGAQEELQTVLCLRSVGSRGVGAREQRSTFLLGLPALGQVHHEGHPRQRLLGDDGCTDQHRHATARGVHELLLVGLAGPAVPQLRDARVVAGSPLRRGHGSPVHPAVREVGPVVADHRQERVVGLEDAPLVGQHEAEHVGVAQAPQEAVPLPQGGGCSALLGQVGEHRVDASRHAVRVGCLGHRGDEQPPSLARLPVPHTHDDVPHDVCGPQRLHGRVLAAGEG